MRTGRFVIGMLVRVIGKHSKKGHFGMIVDYHRFVSAPDKDGLLAPEAQWGDIRKDVRVHVRMDGSYLVEELGLDNLVEREWVFSFQPAAGAERMACSSGLAVLMALLLREFRKVNPFEQNIQERMEPSPPMLQSTDLTAAESRSLASTRPDVGT